MRIEQHEIHVDYQRVGAVQVGSQPILHAYLLDASAELPRNATRPAVIVCPGGAYMFKSDREAEPRHVDHQLSCGSGPAAAPA